VTVDPFVNEYCVVVVGALRARKPTSKGKTVLLGSLMLLDSIKLIAIFGMTVVRLLGTMNDN
jgi:hypothetical protein